MSPYVDDPAYEEVPALIRSYALLDGGSTCCFDTGSGAWSKAGSWTLPLYGRAEHVPELNQLWLGTLYCSPNHLFALDLSLRHGQGSEVAARVARPRPARRLGSKKVQPRLPNLGAGRFCVAKIFSIVDEDTGDPMGMASVLTGVEAVVQGGGAAGSTTFRMIKHKPKRYSFLTDGDAIHRVL